MEPISELGNVRDDVDMELPSGFRFHPTDEELITHYLSPKIRESKFTARAIGEVDLNNVEPWDLPWRAKMGEKEWYFFCVRDRKYPTGLRVNRATKAGYWKATGKDKEIYKLKTLIGMKKTLVFYKGRAPRGEKSNWVMHEYRLESKTSFYNLPKTAKNEWVISRIFHKSSGGKKIHISGLMETNNHENEFWSSNMPPLMDCLSQDGHTKSLISTSHVTCFSEPLEDIKPKENIFDRYNMSLPTSQPYDTFHVSSVLDTFFSTQFLPNKENLPDLDFVMAQDQYFLEIFHQNNYFNMKRNFKTEFSLDPGTSTDIYSVLSNHGMGQRCYNDREDFITSDGPVELNCLWNY